MTDDWENSRNLATLLHMALEASKLDGKVGPMTEMGAAQLGAVIDIRRAADWFFAMASGMMSGGPFPRRCLLCSKLNPCPDHPQQTQLAELVKNGQAIAEIIAREVNGPRG